MNETDVIYTVVHQERLGFSVRLMQALSVAAYATAGATEVSRLYNVHCTTQVSQSAVRKWLNGESILSGEGAN